MVDEKASFTKEYILILIWESWNHFEKEYGFRLVKSIHEWNKAFIKACEEVTKY